MTAKTKPEPQSLWAPRPEQPEEKTMDRPQQTLAPLPAAPPGPPSPMAMIQAAIEHKMDPAGLEKLTDLAERWRKMDAEQQFNEAMVACQAEMPSVVKDAKAEKSAYAKYETIIRSAKPVYTKHGFAVTFVECTMIGELTMRVVGDVVHRGGHVKRHIFELGLDGVGPKGQPLAMNRPQASGSTSSYGQRYLIIRAFNIPVADEDDDAAQARSHCITPEQTGVLNDLMDACRKANIPVNFPAFLKWLEVENLGDLKQSEFPKAKRQLESKLAKGVVK